MSAWLQMNSFLYANIVNKCEAGKLKVLNVVVIH